MRLRTRSIAFVLGLWLAAPHDGIAVEPADAYAVVSLIGDAITVVQYRPVTDGIGPQNYVQQFALGDAHFDAIATRTAANTLERVRPGAVAQAVEVPADDAFGDGRAIFAPDGTLPRLLDAVRPALAATHPRWLVVISKFRDDAQLRLRSGTIGAGKLAGLGFYVDPGKGMRDSRTRESGRGFIGTYAYVRADLVDLASGAVVRTNTAAQSATRANAGGDTDLNPWDRLSADEKVHLLDNVLRRAVNETVTRVAAPA